MPAPPSQITQLLLAWRNGDKTALDKLMPRVYKELRKMARHYMAAERPGHTLQTTALINEAYLRLVDHKEMRWQNRAHFFGVAAQAMRRVLVDHARSRDAAKRGGGAINASLEEAAEIPAKTVELVALDAALNDLAAIDPRASQVVELRYFGGLSVEETAEVLQVSPVTVMRDWRAARAWLLRAISQRSGVTKQRF
jgi:RNA polymerase sigma factor (TIGR02999 family)